MAVMDDFQQLYQDIILDHNKRPRNYRVMPAPTHRAEGYNPLCGDQVTLQLVVEEGRIREIAFTGEGCAISRASASLLTVALEGKSVPEALCEVRSILQMLTAADAQVDVERYGDVAALSGVRQFPARVKCATLAWRTLEEALGNSGKVVSSE